MKTKAKDKVTIVEWDGDGITDAGGFDIELVVKGMKHKVECGSYNTMEEYKKELHKARKKAEKLAIMWDIKGVKEKLYDCTEEKEA